MVYCNSSFHSFCLFSKYQCGHSKMGFKNVNSAWYSSLLFKLEECRELTEKKVVWIKALRDAGCCFCDRLSSKFFKHSIWKWLQIIHFIFPEFNVKCGLKNYFLKFWVSYYPHAGVTGLTTTAAGMVGTVGGLLGYILSGICGQNQTEPSDVWPSSAVCPWLDI